MSLKKILPRHFQPYNLLPFNRSCALSPTGLYTGELTYDYPSEEDIISIFHSKKITPIFGVTSDSTWEYEYLRQNIPNSAIGILNRDSSNVVNLLINQYNQIEQRTKLERIGGDDGSLNIRYFSSCNGGSLQETNVCDELGPDGTVTFTISINLKDCIGTGGETLVRIEPEGLPTAFQVAFNTICDDYWGR